MPAVKPITASNLSKRAEKSIKDKEARALAEQERGIKNAKFMAELPMRVLKMMARANARGNVTVEVKGGTEQNLLRVEFYFRQDGERYSDEKIVYLDHFSENLLWVIPEIEEKFDEMDAADAEAARLLAVAREAYDILTEDQRVALNLHRRP